MHAPLPSLCVLLLNLLPSLTQPQEVALAQQLKGTVLPHIPKAKKEKARGISKRQRKYSCFNALRRVSCGPLVVFLVPPVCVCVCGATDTSSSRCGWIMVEYFTLSLHIPRVVVVGGLWSSIPPCRCRYPGWLLWVDYG